MNSNQEKIFNLVCDLVVSVLGKRKREREVKRSLFSFFIFFCLGLGCHNNFHAVVRNRHNCSLCLFSLFSLFFPLFSLSLLKVEKFIAQTA